MTAKPLHVCKEIFSWAQLPDPKCSPCHSWHPANDVNMIPTIVATNHIDLEPNDFKWICLADSQTLKTARIPTAQLFGEFSQQAREHRAVRCYFKYYDICDNVCVIFIA